MVFTMLLADRILYSTQFLTKTFYSPLLCSSPFITHAMIYNLLIYIIPHFTFINHFSAVIMHICSNGKVQSPFIYVLKFPKVYTDTTHHLQLSLARKKILKPQFPIYHNGGNTTVQIPTY